MLSPRGPILSARRGYTIDLRPASESEHDRILKDLQKVFLRKRPNVWLNHL